MCIEPRVLSECHKHAWRHLEQAAQRLERLLEAEGAIFDEVSGQWRFTRPVPESFAAILAASNAVAEAQWIIEGLEEDLPC